MLREIQKLLTVPEAAERLALKEATIRRRILERKIAYVKLGRSVRIPVEAVERLCKEGYVPEVKTNEFSNKQNGETS